MYTKIAYKRYILFEDPSPMLNCSLLVLYCFTRSHTCLVDCLQLHVAHTELRVNSLSIHYITKAFLGIVRPQYKKFSRVGSTTVIRWLAVIRSAHTFYCIGVKFNVQRVPDSIQITSMSVQTSIYTFFLQFVESKDQTNGHKLQTKQQVQSFLLLRS
jgi:hypothetical protein